MTTLRNKATKKKASKKKGAKKKASKKKASKKKASKKGTKKKASKKRAKKPKAGKWKPSGKLEWDIAKDGQSAMGFGVMPELPQIVAFVSKGETPDQGFVLTMWNWEHQDAEPQFVKLLGGGYLTLEEGIAAGDDIRVKSTRVANPGRAEHAKQAKADLERAQQDLERARRHIEAEEPGEALMEVALSLAAAACARCEAVNAGEGELSKEAAEAMRDAGDTVLLAVKQVQVLSGGEILVANPNGRHPSGSPNFLIRTRSSALTAGSKDIYLVVNTEGEVMDAVITEGQDFGPVEGSGYGDLGILELDVSGAQYRKLLKLAKQLHSVFSARPTFRPGRGGAMVRRRPERPGAPLARISTTKRRVAANPLKSRLMR